ncbi:MAG TPA: hypothetical protein VK960_01305 [Acidimicrobiia bacterium]|nr:hypothetical protein [Acidimicrobiia bacterium]
MTEFTVHLANRPGMLAALTERIAEAGVHIEALAAFGMDEMGVAHIVVTDAATTRGVLSRAGMAFEERNVLTTVLEPGPAAVAEMAHSLAEAGVNIEAIYLLRTNGEYSEFAIAVDKPALAETRLAS